MSVERWLRLIGGGFVAASERFESATVSSVVRLQMRRTCLELRKRLDRVIFENVVFDLQRNWAHRSVHPLPLEEIGCIVEVVNEVQSLLVECFVSVLLVLGEAGGGRLEFHRVVLSS